MDLCRLFSANGRVLATIWLAKRGSLGLDGVLEQQSAAQVIFSVADYVAELLEEGFLAAAAERARGVPGQAAGGSGWRQAVAVVSR